MPCQRQVFQRLFFLMSRINVLCFHLLQDFVVAHVFSAYYSQYPSVQPRLLLHVFASPVIAIYVIHFHIGWPMLHDSAALLSLFAMNVSCLLKQCFLFVPPMHIWISESRFHFSVKIIPRFCFTFFHLLLICMLSVLFADNHVFCI